MPKPMLPRELLKTLFMYTDGVLYWRTRPREHFATKRACSVWNARFPGARAGSVTVGGYRQIDIFASGYKAHRVIFFLLTGLEPGGIDHINGDTSDNRIENLRAATHTQNMQNVRRRSDSTSGFKGVSFRKDRGDWQAYIAHGEKRVHLGFHPLPEIAAKAYNEAAVKFHGEFASLNEV